MSIASCTSPPASALTFPISRVIRSVSSSFASRTSSAKRKRISPRRGAGTRRQSSYAAFADATARPTSSGVDRGNVPIRSPVAGLLDSKVSTATAVRVYLRDVEAREGACGAKPAAIAELAHPAVRLAPAPVGTGAPVNDDAHIGVLPVVSRHLLEELGF